MNRKATLKLLSLTVICVCMRPALEGAGPSLTDNPAQRYLLVRKLSASCSLSWDGTDLLDHRLPAGVYFVHLNNPGLGTLRAVLTR